jgi:hypothetical protein
MQSITQSQLAALLYATSKTQLVSLVSVTEPAMRKRGNPYATARKVSLITGVVNFSYSRAVNRQRAREYAGRGPSQRPPQRFRALRRSWGKRIQNTPLVSLEVETEEDTELELYLEVKCERRHFLFFDPKTRKRIQDEVISPFLRKHERNPRQGLEREVVLRDYRLDHIAELTIAGSQYRISPASTELLRYLPPKKPTRKPTASKA